jgi:glycerol uptake facilitator-like aquaporin
MKTSERALPLLLEFVGTAAMALVLYAALLRSGQVFGAIGIGAVYAGVLLAARPNYVPQLNPVISFALMILGKLSIFRTVATIAVQLLAGYASWQLIEYVLDRPLTSIAGDEFVWQVFVAELVGAFVFTFMLSFAFFSNKIEDGKLAAVAFTGLLVGMLIASMPQGAFGIINPAVALGIQSWSYVFILGPLVGGTAGLLVIPTLQLFDRAATKPKAKSKKTIKKTTVKKVVKKK